MAAVPLRQAGPGQKRSVGGTEPAALGLRSLYPQGGIRLDRSGDAWDGGRVGGR